LCAGGLKACGNDQGCGEDSGLHTGETRMAGER
jgi:hypothetical protein